MRQGFESVCLNTRSSPGTGLTGDESCLQSQGTVSSPQGSSGLSVNLLGLRMRSSASTAHHSYL